MTHRFFFLHCDPSDIWFDQRVLNRIFDWAKVGVELCHDIAQFEFYPDLESQPEAKKNDIHSTLVISTSLKHVWYINCVVVITTGLGQQGQKFQKAKKPQKTKILL
jgi:hypothetical protein